MTTHTKHTEADISFLNTIGINKGKIQLGWETWAALADHVTDVHFNGDPIKEERIDPTGTEFKSHLLAFTKG